MAYGDSTQTSASPKAPATFNPALLRPPLRRDCRLTCNPLTLGGVICCRGSLVREISSSNTSPRPSRGFYLLAPIQSPCLARYTEPSVFLALWAAASNVDGETGVHFQSSFQALISQLQTSCGYTMILLLNLLASAKTRRNPCVDIINVKV